MIPLLSIKDLIAVLEGDLIDVAVAELIVRIAALALEVYPCILVSHQSCQQVRQLRSFCDTVVKTPSLV